MPNPATPFWTDAEIARLDDFLSREDGPENTMSVSMLDGYLCAIVSAPNLVMPGEMLRWVWDMENGQDEPAFASSAEATDIINLIMRQWNAINDTLTNEPQAYEPWIGVNQHQGHEVAVLDDWCEGYYIAMQIDLPSWTPLLAAKPQWFSTILTYGTADGDELLMGKAFDLAQHQAATAALKAQAHAIHAHNLALRSQQLGSGNLPTPIFRQEPIRRTEPKLGRNDPCHCGSGRKYKHCHGAH